MLFLLLALNFGISWFNAWSCGCSSAESKTAGGLLRLLWWMGAVMSAAGFTWVLTVVLGLGAHALGYLPTRYLEAELSLGYLIVIGPVIGSGLVITVQAWAVAWRRRTAVNLGVAAWDTFAMVYDITSAVEGVPYALGKVKDVLIPDSDDDKDGALIRLAILLALLGLVGGALLTYAIIHKTARQHALDVRLQYETA